MISSVDLITNFQEEFKDKYPDVSLEEMKLICTAPFEMMKEVMESGSLEDIRLQYLFVAKVSAPRVIRHLKDIYSKKSANNISERGFEKYNNLLLSHISSNPKKFLKYESKIKEITGKSLSQLCN